MKVLQFAQDGQVQVNSKSPQLRDKTEIFFSFSSHLRSLSTLTVSNTVPVVTTGYVHLQKKKKRQEGEDLG